MPDLVDNRLPVVVIDDQPFIAKLIEVNLPGVAEKRYLVIFDKAAATPPNYPRRVGVPSKTPLK